MHNSPRRKYTILAVIILAILVIVFYRYKQEVAETPATPTVISPRNGLQEEVPMLKVFPDKIVYTDDITSDKELYMGDCSMRGGTFNNCGTGCETGAEMCIMSCAYTCTLPVGQ